MSRCSPHTSNTVANSAQRLEVTPLKEGEYKTQRGMFGDLWMEIRQEGLGGRRGQVWSSELGNQRSVEEFCQEPQVGTEPRNDWAEECLVLGP